MLSEASKTTGDGWTRRARDACWKALPLPDVRFARRRQGLECAAAVCLGSKSCLGPECVSMADGRSGLQSHANGHEQTNRVERRELTTELNYDDGCFPDSLPPHKHVGDWAFRPFNASPFAGRLN